VDKKKRKWLIGGGIALLLVLIILGNLKKSPPKRIVQTAKVTRGELIATVSGPAKIQPEIQVKISAKVSGQIIRLGVQEGDRVQKGQFLVQLDPEFYKAEVEQASSNLKFAMASFEKTKREYERTEKLFGENLASASELEMAKASYEQAKAQIEQYQALLKQAEDNLSKTTIYSPMDGIVTQLNKKVGEMAMGSQFTLDVIMVIADLSKILAETEIDENDIVAVSVGDTAHITIDAFSDTLFKGVVTEIANTGTAKNIGTQEEVTNFLVKVLMLTKPKELRPGMSATVDIITEKKQNVLKVPFQCVTTRKPVADQPKTKDKGSKKEKKAQKTQEVASSPEKPIKVVFVIKNGVAHQVPVETGISSDTEIEIVKGVSEGVEVVSGSYRILTKQLQHLDRVKVDNTVKSKEEKI